jgi:hypothetical protein
MAYTIIRSNGSQLTTIQDGTINTTSTSLGLPGRNYAGYGQILNTNFVRLVENFASGDVPPNPIKGQLWFNTTANTLNLCTVNGESNASNWLTLASTSSGANLLTAGNLTISNNITAANLEVTNSINTYYLTTFDATVSNSLTAVSGNITSADIPTLNTQSITTGGQTTKGTMTGYWEVYGNNATGGNVFDIRAGNIAFASSSYGIKTDKYMWANGQPYTPSGTYNDTNVASYLSNSTGGFSGAIYPSSVTTSAIAGGGTVSGIWTLTSGARFQATYADLAERFESDEPYEPGTVVEIGGDKEITSVKEELSETVFGVVSNTAAMLMNGAAGDDKTHPPVAVSGRVQVKVNGRVKKGDRLVSAGNGTARVALTEELTAFNTIGRALGNKNTDGLGTVEAIVIIR